MSRASVKAEHERVELGPIPPFDGRQTDPGGDRRIGPSERFAHSVEEIEGAGNRHWALMSSGWASITGYRDCCPRRPRSGARVSAALRRPSRIRLASARPAC